MFTGLVTEIGVVGEIRRVTDGMNYEVFCNAVTNNLKIGSSVAVNGVCQTVTMLTRKGFMTEAVESTIAKTTISKLRTGDRVNLEPALRAGEPLDGHIMQGHIQQKSRLLSCRKSGNANVLEIEMEEALSCGIIPEGSVGLDGVSLTVSSVGLRSFTVHIIPETWNCTIFRWKKPGDYLNVEGDFFVRSSQDLTPGTGLKINNLVEWGY